MSLFCPECQSSYADETMRVCPRDGTRLYRVDDDDPLIGGVLDGRFRIDYTLGVGGMGTVYGGVQLSVNRDVAVKVLRTELATREVALERFFREAKTISNLTHPNIVKLIDFGQDRERGLLYLVMELVRGRNLADLVKEGRMRAAMALEVVYQVCGALTEPHAAGVIHRDLKPDNLLMTPVSDGTAQVKVLDFGIARFMESNTQLTGTGMICGTPAYMAPEQAQNETLDATTDLYALGVILYEMLSGWPPFSGTSSLQVMLKHIQENPPRLRDLLPPATLPDSIEELVYDLMSKERNARPESARQVRDRIDGIRAELALDPVRLKVEPDDPFDEWILHKLPRPDKDKSGPTQVLRRETGLEQAVLTGAAEPAGAGPTPGAVPDLEGPTKVWSGDTKADSRLGVTGPLTPNGEAEVAADAALGVKIDTREGGQQAWTPGDQAAVRSIKDTKDNVDVHGATIDAPSVERLAAEQRRKTMVESDASAPLVATPETGDELPSTRRSMRAEPVNRPTKDRQEVRSSSRSNVPLAIIAVLAGVGAIAAALYVVQKVESLSAAQVEPISVVANDTTPATNLPPTDDPGDPALLAEFVNARHRAWDRLHDGLDTATTAAARDARRTTPPRPDPQPVVEKKPEPRNKPAADKAAGNGNPDSLVESLKLRDE